MNPKFPIYIPSYSRWDSKLTMNALDKMGVSYFVVVEKEQYDKYVEVFGKSKVLAIPDKYHKEYDTFDDLGESKSQGPGPSRNFAWEHSIKNGHKWHWVMDDNILKFYRYNNNQTIQVSDGTILKCMEDFCLRYKNVVMAGPNYFMFIAKKQKYPPFSINTRIYSCNLIRNDVPYRWRGRYNEDTDLSLRMLKDGLCTIQFNAFLQDKINTQKIKGGNTERFYDIEGTYPKSKMLKEMHPDVTKLVWKFNRWHHIVDYTSFKKLNKLVKRDDLNVPNTINNYGMKLDKIHKTTQSEING